MEITFVIAVLAVVLCVKFLLRQCASIRERIAKRIVLFGLRDSGQGIQLQIEAWQAAIRFIGFRAKLRVERGYLLAAGADADMAGDWIIFVKNNCSHPDFDESVRLVVTAMKHWSDVVKQGS